MKAKYPGVCSECGELIHPGDGILRRNRRWIHDRCGRPMTRDEAEYQRGKAEVEQIQAISTAGSAFREQLYLEMEQAAYNRGDDY